MTLGSNIALHLAIYAITFALLDSDTGGGLWAVALGSILIWASIIDFATFEIPDLASLALLLSGAVWICASPGISVPDHVLGGLLWPLLVWLLATSYFRVRGWQGLGFGDVKLLSGIGLWLGFQATISVIFTASLAGILWLTAIGTLRRTSFRETRMSAVAFGPFLCLSAWVIWLRGQG